jgi:hypothetical protein
MDHCLETVFGSSVARQWSVSRSAVLGCGGGRVFGEKLVWGRGSHLVGVVGHVWGMLGLG